MPRPQLIRTEGRGTEFNAFIAQVNARQASTICFHMSDIDVDGKLHTLKNSIQINVR